MKNNTIRHELGYFGNIWVRKNFLRKAGESAPGHEHKFDHVSLLTRGSVRVEVEGHPPRDFHADTFIIIKKEHVHKFTALTDDVVWYCVFALRDVDGEVTDIYDGDNSPYGALPAGFWEANNSKLKALSIEDETGQ